MSESEAVERLLGESPEFREAYAEHRRYRKIVDKLDKKPILTGEEEEEKKRLKKLKLRLKDRMERIMAEQG